MPRGYKASGRYPIAIKGVDPQLRQWLKARAALEDCPVGQLLNCIILRYRDEVGWSQTNASRQPNPHPSLTVRGLSPQLWEWVKARAAQENKYAGDVINDLLRHHIATTLAGDFDIPDSTLTSDPEYVISIKGVDRVLWQHLKDGAALEQKTIGEALNQLLDWYRRTVT